VFAAYNSYGTASSTEVAKDIEVYSYNEHEGGQTYQQDAQLDWFANIFDTTS
jgi:cephalosporin-C deacetylase